MVPGSVDKDQIYTIPQSEQVVQASAAGVSIVEYAKHSSVERDVKGLCNAVRRLVGVKKEK